MKAKYTERFGHVKIERATFDRMREAARVRKMKMHDFATETAQKGLNVMRVPSLEEMEAAK